MNGLLVVNKEKFMTSRDVVNKLTSLFGIKKIGHTGTLDPLASGVLVICIGKYTKLVDLITSEYKEYIATIKLGIATDTLDITGNVIETSNIKEFKEEEIIKVLNKYLGKQMQTVPKYSAIHVNGKRLYEYARNNEDVILPKREVEIKEIELLNYCNDEIKFRCVVSKGTYIRSLIKDICDNLEICGTMQDLIRTKQGTFSLNNAFTLDDIKNGNYKLLKLEDFFNIKIVIISNEMLKKVSNGNKINANYDGYVLYKNNEVDIALYSFENNVGHLVILF